MEGREGGEGKVDRKEVLSWVEKSKWFVEKQGVGNKEVFCAHVVRTISFSRTLRSPTVVIRSNAGNFLFSISA